MFLWCKDGFIMSDELDYELQKYTIIIFAYLRKCDFSAHGSSAQLL